MYPGVPIIWDFVKNEHIRKHDGTGFEKCCVDLVDKQAKEIDQSIVIAVCHREGLRGIIRHQKELIRSLYLIPHVARFKYALDRETGKFKYTQGIGEHVSIDKKSE